MERSFTQSIDLRCVACGQFFSADIWLIVDVEERPDLMAQINDERIHVASCLHCGTTHLVEAPLLVHHSAAQTLIFSPQEHRTPAESQTVAQQLGQLLISRIPVDQRQPYLATAQVVSSKEALRRVLTERVVVEDELSAALQALMAAQSTEHIHAVAQAHAVLTTQDAQNQLASYVQRLRQDQHLATAEALDQRLKVLRTRPSLTLQIIQTLLDAASPDERQQILQDHVGTLPGDISDVLEALAEQAQRQQLDAVARDLRVLRTEVLRQLEQSS